MIYSGNHTVTTAKSASYLGNVGIELYSTVKSICPVRINKVDVLMKLQCEVVEGLWRLHVSQLSDKK